MISSIDQSSLFKGTVVPEDRSLMNVPFVTGNADLDAKFVKEAAEAGLVNLKGHRTVGGMRASIYNAMPYEGVEALVAFMKRRIGRMYKYHCLNPISNVGLGELDENYVVTENPDEADAIFVRSAKMHEMEFGKNLKAVARAGAGVNNIPLDRCADEGIVVFNTPGANANGVKELAIAGMLLAARDIIGGINWVQEYEEDGDIAKITEKKKKAFAGTEIQGKKLGVIGLGAIGVQVANAACTAMIRMCLWLPPGICPEASIMRRR